MDENKISLRYAKALFSLAKEKAVLDEVKRDIDLILGSIKAVPEFRLILGSPVVKTTDKRALIKDTFSGEITSMTSSFLNLLLTNKRESYLEEISRNFIALFRSFKGYKSAVLASAIPIDPKTVELFRELIRKRFKTEVDLSFDVKKDLIGGFVLRVEDQQIDASVSSKLKQLKQELTRKI